MQKNKLSRLFLVILIVIAAAQLVAAAPSLSLIYVIQQGDTLSEIAAEYETSLKKLKKINQISNSAAIKMGDELVIPQPDVAAEKENQETQRAQETENSQAAQKDQEKKGTQINLGYQSKKESLSFSINTHYAARINPGQELPDIKDIPRDKIISYNVGPGDTLYDLARDFSTSIGTILALNKKENSSLRTGEKIRIPVHNLTPHQVLNHRVSKQELELLARAVYGESRGEPYLGQIAVAAVIINRVLSWQFPNTFAQVIYQRGQFSAVGDGQINLRPNRTAYRAARAALKGNDPTNGAFFYNPKTATRVSFFKGRRVITQIGDHLFVE